MSVQASEGSGIRKGLLLVHQKYFSHNRTFIPVSVEGTAVNVITSDMQCPELITFYRDHRGVVNIISTDSHTVEVGRLNLYDDLDSNPLNALELQEFTDFAIAYTPS